MFPTKQDFSESEDQKTQADPEDRHNAFKQDETIFTAENNRNDDLHLQLSEKYMIYKDYADRCMTNPQHMGKEDHRVFYMRPESLFLQDPRFQSHFRTEFIRQLSTVPSPEPFTLMMDDFHKALIEDVRFRNDPTSVKDEMVKFFKRRQYRLQHKKHKYIQRWSHFALTSELVDKVSLKFSPNYSKLQFEIENAVKRWQRLDGEDHFATNEPRPQRKEANGEISQDDLLVENLPKYCSLRVDDLDVYTRITGYEERCSRATEKFVNRAKWAPMSHRFNIYTQAQEYFQECRNNAIAKLKMHSERVKTKASELIDRKKMGDRGFKEMAELISTQQFSKFERRQRGVRDEFMQKGKSTYDLPPTVLWNQVELKLALEDLSKQFGIYGDMELDNGNSFSYQIIVQFPTFFHTQVLRSQFALYDAIPSLIHTGQLGKNIQKVMQRNLKKYGKTSGQNTLLERLEIAKESELHKIEFINQIERALFGEFNNGQLDEVPKVRLKKSFWLEWICFKAEISTEQMHQAALLNSEMNPVDECTACMFEVVNVNDVANVNLTLESLSQIHCEKIKHGKVKTDFMNTDHANTESYLTEQQQSFLSLFSKSLQTKFEQDQRNNEGEDHVKNSLFDTPQHLLFAHYLLVCLQARDKKNQLLYTLNAFRAIQKRLTLELREFGSRDRVMGDCNIMKPNEKLSISKTEDVGEESVSGSVGNATQSIANAVTSIQNMNNESTIDNVVQDELVDINRYRYNNCFSNKQMSTCPILPKYHVAYGMPTDRQEVSAEFEQTKDSDPKKGQAANLLGRVDKIEEHTQSKCYIVTDDFGVNVMYDATFGDMRAIEQELLKIVSFYINKVEPIAEVDLRNIFPAVDRFQIVADVIICEEEYQRAKLKLCLHYLECFEHTCDTLDQQRLVQIIVDLMAKRPRINLEGNHFKDSYKAEIEALEMQTKLIREFIDMQMDLEFKANTDVREYLEKTYQIIYQQIGGEWGYYPQEDVQDELVKRTLENQGVKNDDEAIMVGKLRKDKPGVFQAKMTSHDPKTFADMLGIPYQSLLMLLKEHHERDQVVRQTLHEHTSFIKIQEGYPMFIYDTAVKKQNKVKMIEQSKEIGILDFYESLAQITKIVAVCQYSVKEIFDVHKPDNGLISAALELNTFKYLLAELRAVKGEERGDQIVQNHDLDQIQDDSILGNSDKMLFHTKELIGTISYSKLVGNPVLMTKLDLDTIKEFDFEEIQDERARNLNKIEVKTEEQKKKEALSKVDDELADAYMKAFELNEVDLDYEKKMKQHQKEKDEKYPRLKQKEPRANVPSMLQLCCNGVEAMRLRHMLVQAIIQREVLKKIYGTQMQQMDKEGARVNFPDHFHMDFTMQKGEFWVNWVDTAPDFVKKSTIQTTYCIKEFDPSLTTVLNFADPEAFKALICPMGIEELRLVLRYELTNLSMLVVATRTNQILLDNALRQLAEVDMFARGYSATAPAFDLFNRLVGQNVYETNLKRMPEQERIKLNDYIKQGIRPMSFDVMSRKSKSKNRVEKQFTKMKSWVLQQHAEKPMKDEVQLRMLRTCRMLLCHDYLEELCGQIAMDTLKLELLHETNQIRLRAYFMPRDSRVHTLNPAKNGEHQFAAYQEEEDENFNYLPFYDSDANRIKSFFQVPSFKEIMSIDPQTSKFQHINMQQLWQFDVFGKESPDPAKQLPSLLQNEHLGLVKARLPRLTTIDIKEADNFSKERLRLVDFREAYNLSGNLATKYLFYFRNLQNLFDLEFFINKLPSKTRNMSGLEHRVSSGLHFWEDPEDNTTFDEEDDYLDSAKTNDPQYSRVNEHIETQYKNQVSAKIAERIAHDKKNKLQLMQELDSIKDHFNEWQTSMRCQDLDQDMFAAANFLNEQVQNNYLLLLLVLYNLLDSHGTAGTCQREMHDIRHVVKMLTHQEDQKVTYTNGFHVNTSVTSISRITLDQSCFRQDYANFFKAAQPVIDEEGLNPTEFNLLAGMYLIKYDNMKTYRKDRRYLGIMPDRDFHYLDRKLLNLDLSIRKYIPNTIMSFDTVAKQYAHQRLRVTNELAYVSNANTQREVFQEKKTFNKQLIRSRQLKRCFMILLSKQPLPFDAKEFKKLIEHSQEIVHWKIINKMDDIEKARQLAAEANRAKRAKFQQESKDMIKMIALAIKRDEPNREVANLIQQYDQASCEVEVYQKEILTYMIVVGKNMIERETKSLARAFEMNGKRLEVLIKPVQQFASTFDQEVDKKNHLDIINKVGPVQKMLTQMKNRCLEIETLTSGHGIVISSKDLNETLKELCRGIVQFNEIEMRTRCEQLYLLIKEYENQLYMKDQQLLNMEHKLKHAKEELNKIVNTKVFSRGNNLIYELDKSARQLRLIKDNIHALESGVKEKVKLYYEKDLNDTRMQLSELKQNFAKFRENLSASVKNQVHDNIMAMEHEMKVKIKRDDPNQKFESREAELRDKYQQLLKPAQFRTEKQTDELLKEMESVKKSEKEARDELLAIQKYMRLQRLFLGFKDGVKQSKHDFKVDNLNQQLTSNSQLWEQLAEAEKREKILKQELEVSQHEIAMQEKIIDRLKDDLKQESREKQKLMQYRISKSKRLEELETKAREFEVLENVNLQKLLAMMEQKQRRIDLLEKKEYDQDYALDKLMQVANAKVKRAQETKNMETSFKNEAVNKLMEIQHQQELMATVDEKLQADYWRTKFEGLELDMQDQKEENLLLRLQLQSAKNFDHKVLATQRAYSITDSEDKEFGVWTNNSVQGEEPQSGHKRDYLHKQSTMEMSKEDYRKKKEISKQSHLPSILGLPTQQASHQQLIKHKLLPSIRTDNSAAVENEKKVQSFRGRNRSVGPQLHQPFGPKKHVQANVYGGSSIDDEATGAGTSLKQVPSYIHEPSPFVSAEKHRFESSVFNTIGVNADSSKKNASGILMTPIKPIVFGNAKLGAEATIKTQRNPKLTKQPQISNRSDNLFNSLLPTEASVKHEQSIFTDGYHRKPSDGSLGFEASKMLIHTQNAQKKAPNMMAVKFSAGHSPDISEKHQRSIIVPVSSTNTVKLASIPGEQSHTNITEGSHTEEHA